MQGPSTLARPLTHIYVTRSVFDHRRGTLRAGSLRFPVALGRSGISAWKREGDGATPRGNLPLRALWYRADKVPPPRTGLPVRATRKNDLWIDAPGDRNYNRPVRAPSKASHETMWRGDDLYDYVVELGWNDAPRIAGKGSAIFMHLARPGFSPTEGCVALKRRDMERLLPLLGPDTVLVVR